MSHSPGQEVAGKYRIEHLLGKGGMGVVLAARHLELDRLFALKVMRPDKLQDSELLQRFLREARAAGRLHGPHVARVTDVDRMADGSPFIVMEYLAGEDLRRRLGREPALTIEEAVDLAIEVCDALAEAHAAGIVHRDLKPENLFLATGTHGETSLKVLDFGISKIIEPLGTEVETLTSEKVAIGSRSYMSPEQMRSSRDVDHRTDIWSLGVTLYEVLTGALPYREASFPELSAAILRDQPPSLRARRRGVSRALEAVVLRCLRKDPADRFSDAAALALALGPFASAAGRKLAEEIAATAARGAISPSPRVMAAVTVNEPVSSALEETAVSRRNGGVRTEESVEVVTAPPPDRWLAVGIAAVVAAAALFGGVVTYRLREGRTDTSVGERSVTSGTVTEALDSVEAMQIAGTGTTTAVTADTASATPIPSAAATATATAAPSVSGTAPRPRVSPPAPPKPRAGASAEGLRGTRSLFGPFRKDKEKPSGITLAGPLVIPSNDAPMATSVPVSSASAPSAAEAIKKHPPFGVPPPTRVLGRPPVFSP